MDCEFTAKLTPTPVDTFSGRSIAPIEVPWEETHSTNNWSQMRAWDIKMHALKFKSI